MKAVFYVCRTQSEPYRAGGSTGNGGIGLVDRRSQYCRPYEIRDDRQIVDACSRVSRNSLELHENADTVDKDVGVDIPVIIDQPESRSKEQNMNAI